MCAHATEIRQVDQGWEGNRHWVKLRIWCNVCKVWQGQPWTEYK